MRKVTERTMIFCQTCKQCALVYRSFVESLGNDLYVGGKHDVKKRRVDMFHAGTPQSVKKTCFGQFLSGLAHSMSWTGEFIPVFEDVFEDVFEGLTCHVV